MKPTQLPQLCTSCDYVQKGGELTTQQTPANQDPSELHSTRDEAVLLRWTESWKDSSKLKLSSEQIVILINFSLQSEHLDICSFWDTLLLKSVRYLFINVLYFILVH